MRFPSAIPSSRTFSEKVATRWPAGIVTDGGTVIFAGAEEVSAMTVAVAAALFRVTVAETAPAPSVTCAGAVKVKVESGFAVMRMSSIPMPSVVMAKSSYWLKRILKFAL